MDSTDVKLFFAVPLEIWITKKKKFILNLNNYRNAHWSKLSEAKKMYNTHVAELNLINEFDKYPFQNPVRFTYKYYPKTKGSYDRMNILSIHDKFACDALVELGILKDDDYKSVLTPNFLHAGVDVENPRIEIEIKEVIK